MFWLYGTVKFIVNNLLFWYWKTSLKHPGLSDHRTSQKCPPFHDTVNLLVKALVILYHIFYKWPAIKVKPCANTFIFKYLYNLLLTPWFYGAINCVFLWFFGTAKSNNYAFFLDRITSSQYPALMVSNLL